MRPLRGKITSRRGAVLALSNATYTTTALGFITSPILARALGPAGRGEVATATAYALLTAVVLGLGVPASLAHMLGAQRFHRGGLLATVLLYVAFTIPLAILCALGSVVGPLREFSHAGRLATFLLVSLAPLYVLQLCLQSFLVADSSILSLTKVQLVSSVGLTAGVVLAAVLWSLTPVRYTAIYAASIAAGVALSWKYAQVTPRLEFHFAPLLSFGIKAAPAGLANFASLRLDQVLIAPLLGARSLGIYAVAVSLASLPNALGNAIALGSYGDIAAGFVVATAEGLERSARAIRMTIAATATMAVIVCLSAPLGLPLVFGHAFSDSLPPLMILLPGSVALAGSLTAHSVLIAYGRPLAASTAEGAGFFVTIVGLLLFVPRFGIIGAAFVSTVAYLTSMLTFFIILRRMGATRLLPRAGDVRENFAWAVAKVRSVSRVRDSLREE